MFKLSFLSKPCYMRIEVKHILNGNAAVFHNEGLEVFNAFDGSLQKGEIVQLSFDGIQTCSTQFLNACIGKAYLTFPHDFLASNLQVVDYKHMTLFKAKLDNVIDNATNPKYDQIAGEALA